MHKGIKLPCHFNKATLYTTFNQGHCAENGSSRPRPPQISAGFPITRASSAPSSSLRDGVRTSRAPLAIGDRHATEHISVPAPARSWHCGNSFIGSPPAQTRPLPSCLSRLVPTPRTHSRVHTQSRAWAVAHTFTPFTHFSLSLRKPPALWAARVSVTTNDSLSNVRIFGRRQERKRKGWAQSQK